MTEIKKAEFFDDRCYRITENKEHFFITSVTTLLGIESKSFLFKYYGDLGYEEARKRMNEAADRGTRIHFALWVYVSGGTVLYNPWRNPIYTDAEIDKIKSEKNGIVSILKNQDEMLDMWKLQRFFEAVRPDVVKTEFTVYSIPKGIAGTLDLVLSVKKGTYPVSGAKGLTIPRDMTVIADLKTGSVVAESAWAQMAAYKEAYEDMGLGKIDGAMVLHTGASTKQGIDGLSCPIKESKELEFHYEIFQHLAAVWRARNPNFGPKVFQFPTRIEHINIQEK